MPYPRKASLRPAGNPEAGPRRNADSTHTKGSDCDSIFETAASIAEPAIRNAAADPLGGNACVGFLVLPLSDQLH
jgi:hypothetical protein